MNSENLINTESGKVTERALTKAIITSVIGIIVCLICLFGLTWAWFADSVSSNENKIKAASFDLNITVTEASTGDALSPTDGVYILDFTKTYTVSILKNSTASSGFCHISVTLPESTAASVYYTENIPYYGDGTEEIPFVFSLTGFETLKLTPMWGNGEIPSTVSYNSLIQPVQAATDSPKATATANPTATATATPDASSTAVPTAELSESPTAVPTETPTAVSTEMPTEAPTEIPDATPEPTTTASTEPDATEAPASSTPEQE